MRISVLALVTCGLTFTSAAHAQSSESAVGLPPPSPSFREVDHWYGYQTLAVDGGSASLAGLVGGVSQNGAVTAAIFLTGYALGGPIVHLAHGRPLVALESLGLRIVLPGVAGLIGAGIAHVASPNSSDDQEVPPAAVGFIVGATIGGVAAIVLDATALARETVTEPVERNGFTWRPSLLPTRGGGTAGIAGTS